MCNRARSRGEYTERADVAGSLARAAYHRPVVAFPHVEPGAPLVVSATLYRTYRNCPDQALGRLQGAYPPETLVSFKGGLAHRVFARHLEHGPIDVARFTQVCREEIGGGLNPKLSAVGINKPSALAPVIAEVGELYQRFKSLPTDGFRGAEVTVEVEPSPGITLRGAVDAIFDDDEWGTRLVDWKTGTALVGAEDQLDFYALIWALARDEAPGRVEAVSVVTGERRGLTPTEITLDETVSRVGALVSAVRRALASGDELDRSGGPWCSYCPLLDGCTEGEVAVALLART